MDIIYYKNSSDVRVLDKVLTEIGRANIIGKKDMSTLSPQIVVKWESTTTQCNYAYIPDMARFYFVTACVAMTGGRMQIFLQTDVLSSFKNDIRAGSGIVSRQTYKYNPYYNDNLPTLAYSAIITKRFPNNFKNKKTAVLVVCGGAQNGVSGINN